MQFVFMELTEETWSQFYSLVLSEWDGYMYTFQVVCLQTEK